MRGGESGRGDDDAHEERIKMQEAGFCFSSVFLGGQKGAEGAKSAAV